MSNLLRWILFVFGAVIIVAGELLYRGNLGNDVLTMNIIVSLLVWGTVFAGIGLPWIDLSDKSQKRVGSLGMFWVFSSLYAVAAIVWMVVGAHLDLSFNLQLLGHCVLLFFFIMGMAMAKRSSEKVAEVYKKETVEKKGVVDIRKALAALKESTFTANGVPEDVVDRISKMCDEARFMAPSNNDEAHDMEAEIVSLTEGISSAFFNYKMNEASIQQKLSRCERLLKNRKQIHSL